MSRFSARFHSAALPFALAFMAASFAAKAEEVSVALPDLTYLPGEGKLASDTTLSYDRFGESDYEPGLVILSNGQPGQTSTAYFAGKYRQYSYSETETLRYGLIDGLVVGASETCSRVNTFGSYSSGCENPSVSATWRAVTQTDLAEFPVNVDFHAGYSPNLLTGSLERPLAASGGQSGNVELTMSRAFDEVSLLGRVGADWVGKSKQKDSNGDFQWTDSFARPYAELLGQYKPDGEFFLLAGAKVSAGYNVDSSSVFNFGYGFYEQETQRQKNGASYQPELGAAWLAVPDLLSVSLLYSHTFDSTGRAFDPTSGYIDTIYRDVGSDTVSLNIRFQLF